ncbi:MAG: hypothetical protein ACYC91_09220 [Solirubrobacteraceae bacterium]
MAMLHTGSWAESNTLHLRGPLPGSFLSPQGRRARRCSVPLVQRPPRDDLRIAA